ncbi:MAG: hypothetical protein JNN15_11045 [Blastocatellia bacterium]|nr:hypothetical protein [Blastocatellia bacterium]
MKVMKFTATAALGLILLYVGKIVASLTWVLFWAFLFKLLSILKILFSVLVVIGGFYVVWKILGSRDAEDRY